MSTILLCQHCGAPWQPDVTGACRFCRIVAPPPGIPDAGAGAGGRPAIDPDVLCRILLTGTDDRARPLDRLAERLHGVAGDRFTASGTPVSRIQLTLDDWQYQAWLENGDVAGLAVHTVRGVVLKHQPLPFDEWVACVAGHLAEFAATHRAVHDAIVELDRT
jgi:hypothetical protein